MFRTARHESVVIRQSVRPSVVCLQTRIGRVAPTVALGLVIFLSGCATNKYVNQKFAESQQANQQTATQLEELSGRLQSAEAQAQQAYALAANARDEAEKARIYSAAFANYEEIGSKELTFAFDQYVLSDFSRNVLDEIGAMMQQRRDFVLEIAGHTDAIGPDQYNLLLGNNRANAVVRYLNDKFQIPLYRMYTVSYGKSKPKVMAEGRSAQANRRVELRLLGAPGMTGQ